ncbi:hypothetical protein DespoDRAFT_03049 [Desulfobacter postgatei 2ac9]|uniref:Uncharacterized protein n=1 Tax=Desulfobacter postgatei 2ac9 TaxID=879212 RepID=I5B5U5_9BACT|nr:hypothetical protein DespoDRAFT_03049 [Desulfobacter postgatei 2ac9]
MAQVKNEILTIGAKELSWLMDGLSIHQEKHISH